MPNHFQTSAAILIKKVTSIYMCRKDLPPGGHTLYGSEYLKNFVEGQPRTICAKLFSNQIVFGLKIIYFSPLYGIITP